MISAGTEVMRVGPSASCRCLARRVSGPIKCARLCRASPSRVRSRLGVGDGSNGYSYTPLGCSPSGVAVTAVGADVEGFVVGQRVACGEKINSRAARRGQLGCRSISASPFQTHCVLDDHAAFATVGAIALQGFRQSELKLGETALVVGLGLLGQILIRILKAAGVHAFGVDIDAARCQLAAEGGALASAAPGTPEFSALIDELRRETGHAGVDCAFLMAGGKSNQPVELAVECLRDRGRIVDVGKCGLDLPWNESMRKGDRIALLALLRPGPLRPPL